MVYQNHILLGEFIPVAISYLKISPALKWCSIIIKLEDSNKRQLQNASILL